MVQAIVNIDEHTNRILNIIKARFGLRDKSNAIDLMAQQYEEMVLEPELKPEYVKKIKMIEKKGKFYKFKNLSALRKEIENA